MSEIKDNSSKEEMEEEISPVEDLMREHGVLNRILLIYEDAVGKLKSDSVFPWKPCQAQLGLWLDNCRQFQEDILAFLKESTSEDI